MKRHGKYVALYGMAFLISLFGFVLRKTTQTNDVIVVLAVLSAVPILLFITNLVFAKLYVARINNTKVADMQGYMLRHRNEAERTWHKLLKKLRRIRFATTVYAVLLGILAGCASILGGMLYDVVSWALYPCVFYSGTILYVIFSRVHKEQPLILDEKAPVLPKDQYPHIYAIAYRAAQALECKKDITILISLDCNAGIFNDKKQYYLHLGFILLSVLSEEELYCVLLHEFSHCSKKNERAKRELRYGEWLCSEKNLSRFMLFVFNLFSLFDLQYMFNYMTYQYATSVVNEVAADRDMVLHGVPQKAGSALLKINYYDKYDWESGVKNEPSNYEAETPNPNYLKEHVAKFNNAIKTRYEIWNDMLEREIIANNASHPTLKMRLETLNLKKVELVENDSCQEYQDEVKKAVDFADKWFFEINQEDYTLKRNKNYLEPLQRIMAWEESGSPVVAEHYADIISDLKQLGRHQDAEDLCDRAIQELDVNSSQHAYFIKGLTLIHRYDKAGVDLIYNAIEYNSNYLEEGLDEIGMFFCALGMKDELLDYRQRAQQFAQKNKDEFSELSVLSPKDKLSRDDMPESMLNEILAYIRSIDEDIIQNIYLVRKTISEDFFTSAFVIHFYGGTDAQQDEIMHKIFRYLDSYPEKWQFSLFDYFEFPNIKFNKIEGSLVYSKSNKGEKQ